MAVFLAVSVVALFLVGISSALLRWNGVRYRKKGLPPGTMGWPIFGETTEFLKQGPKFMKNQRARWWLLAWILMFFCVSVLADVGRSNVLFCCSLELIWCGNCWYITFKWFFLGWNCSPLLFASLLVYGSLTIASKVVFLFFFFHFNQNKRTRTCTFVFLLGGDWSLLTHKRYLYS